MKKVIILIGIVIGVLMIHNAYLIKISRLENDIVKQKRENERLRKVLFKTRIEYNKVADLKKLEIEMREKKNMKISEEVIYLELKTDTK